MPVRPRGTKPRSGLDNEIATASFGSLATTTNRGQETAPTNGRYPYIAGGILEMPAG
jgi:hypothetical protein